MYTVKNVSGTCKAYEVNNGTETLVCTEGQRVTVNGATYTVGKDGGVCWIFKLTQVTIGGSVKEVKEKICKEGQYI